LRNPKQARLFQVEMIEMWRRPENPAGALIDRVGGVRRTLDSA
jgi:hypothetical protein